MKSNLHVFEKQIRNVENEKIYYKEFFVYIIKYFIMFASLLYLAFL